MPKRSLTIGVAPIKRGFLSMEAAKKQKDITMNIIRQIRPDIVTIVDIDDICENGIAFETDKIDPIVDKFITHKIDALFLLFCDFGEETVAAGIAKRLNVPVLVWGPRDKVPNTFEARGRDTQCGIIAATKVLRRCGIKYSYIVNCDPDSDKFRNGFDTFLRVVSVVKSLKNLKIARIGDRPAPFMSVVSNEAELIERFGIECIPISPSAIADEAEKLMVSNDHELEEYYREFTSRVDCTPMEKRQRMAPGARLHRHLQYAMPCAEKVVPVHHFPVGLPLRFGRVLLVSLLENLPHRAIRFPVRVTSTARLHLKC